jgi:protein-tyrosine-phosphatase
MGEALAPFLGKDYGHQIEAKSAGTMGLIDRPADPKSVDVVAELKLDLSQHKSQGITKELVDWADYILVMERRHGTKIRTRFPKAGDKILELGSFGSLSEIQDPIGGWKFKFRKIRKQIEKCLHSFLRQLPRK